MFKLTDKEWCDILKREYVVNKKSSAKIGDEIGCNQASVIYRLRKHGFKVRPQGQPQSEEHKRKISIALKGKNTWMKGRKLSQKTRDKIAKAGIGRIASVKTRKKLSDINRGRTCPVERRLRISESLRGRYTGKDSPAWKGGKTTESQRIRSLSAYIEWRLSVYKKDEFTCVGCGDNHGGNLQAHHILSFAKYPNKRFDVLNGVTLCKKCHQMMHPDIKFVGTEA